MKLYEQNHKSCMRGEATPNGKTQNKVGKKSFFLKRERRRNFTDLLSISLLKTQQQHKDGRERRREKKREEL